MNAPASIDLRDYIRDVPDFPKPGILFRDITPLLQSPEAFTACIDRLAVLAPPPDAVVAIESRGFVFGAGLALRWKVPLVPARKFGKLPWKTLRETYSLEYGDDSLELHTDSVARGSRVVIVDDLLATGGTAAAAARLVTRLEGKVTAILFVIELTGLGGREALADHSVQALMELPA